jgi:inner membrane protein
MFVAHIPAGYICGKSLLQRFASTGAPAKLLLLTSIIGAIAPDLDLFYFYLIDQRRTPHHLYWPHYPLVWLVLLAASAGWLRAARAKLHAALACMFCIGGMVHVMLDTIVGDIYWLAPFQFAPFSFFVVPSLYQPWWLNFILHWSFLLEVLVAGWAVVLYRRKDAVATQN